MLAPLESNIIRSLSKLLVTANNPDPKSGVTSALVWKGNLFVESNNSNKRIFSLFGQWIRSLGGRLVSGVMGSRVESGS